VIRWAGTEGGHVGEPFWSAAESSLTAGKGDPFGAVWAPGECDTCFQGSSCSTNQDESAGAATALSLRSNLHPEQQQAGNPYGGCWFYNQGLCPKSLSELVSSYHDSVGHNAFWLLDWTPNQTGLLRPDHVKRYSELGAWLTECYGGSPAAAGPPNAPISNVGTIITIPVAAGVSVDRIVLREDQSVGQRIMGFEVLQGQSASATAAANTTSAKASSDAGFTLLLSGQSIGNRFIGFLPSPVTGPTSLVVNVTSVDGTATLTTSAAYNCSRTPAPAGCAYHQNFAYKIVPSITISTSENSSPSKCCALCRKHVECAVFVLDPKKVCTVMSANQGGEGIAGFLSGESA